MIERPYQIYQITFAKTLKYIGFTKKNVYERVVEHQKQPVNVNLAKNFRWGRPWEVLILKRCETEEEARYYEKKIIIEAHCENWEEVLNIYAGGRKLKPHIEYDKDQSKLQKWDRSKKYCKPPDHAGTYRCSKCKIYKSGSEFYSDKSRFNGLHSTCKECAKKRAHKMRSNRFKESVNKEKVTCGSCGVEKYQHLFVPESLKTEPVCRACVRTKKFNREPDRDATYKCKRCKKKKIGWEFYLNSNTYNGLSCYCIECNSKSREKKGHKKRSDPERYKLRCQGKKKCSSCQKIFNRSEFRYKNKAKTKLSTYCRSCEVEKNREYYRNYRAKAKERVEQEKREKRNEATKRWREKNKEKVKAYNKSYKADNREKVNVYQREWMQKNREKHLDYRRKWYQKNKQKLKNEKTTENVKAN